MAEATEKPLFRLSEDITEEDIPIMAAIGHESFKDDTHTNLKIFHIPQKAGVDESGLRGQLKNPASCHVIKAVHNETNEIMGHICWAHRGYIPRVHRPEATSGRFSELSPDGEGAKKTKVQVMEDMEDKHFTDFMTDIMPEGTKCWFVGGLNVAPKFQRMGIATALLNWGTSRAEKDGVFAWVHSSDSAWQAYAACGFEIVRVLRTDLDAYAEGTAVNAGPGEGGKWGIYTVRYMVYKPERIGANGWEVIKDIESVPIS
jgi:GNAT superfamily N-acetyltransferase